jgi:hypothetical protein
LNHATKARAITGAAPSTLLAPHLTDFSVLELLVDDEMFADVRVLAEAIGGTVVDRGHVVEVRALPTPISAQGPVIHGLHVALPARVDADLLAAGDRFVDAAYHRKETVDVEPFT